MDLLGQLLVTALAALLGAWGGAQAALARFKEERAFHLRYEWYHETIRALWNARVKLTQWANEVERDEEGRGVVSKDVFGEIYDSMQRAIGLGIEGRMLAKEVSFDEVRESRERLANLYEDVGTETPEYVKAIRHSALDFEETARKLADHGREHLDFTPFGERGRLDQVRAHVSGLISALLPRSR